jgi:hypothetical protein
MNFGTHFEGEARNDEDDKVEADTETVTILAAPVQQTTITITEAEQPERKTTSVMTLSGDSSIYMISQ